MKNETMNGVLNISDSYNKIKYQHDYSACMKNELILGKQDLTIREEKLLLILISQVMTISKEFKLHKIRIVELAKLLKINEKSLYRDIEKILDSLHRKYVSIEDKSLGPNSEWIKIGWLQKSKYDGNGTIEIQLCTDLYPYLLGLEFKDYWTQIRLDEGLEFSAASGLRLYKILKLYWTQNKKFINKFSFQVSHLKELFACEDKYAKYSSFKSRVISSAVDQINENKYAQFTVQFEEIKEGVSVSDIVFTLTPKSYVPEENISLSKIISEPLPSIT